MSAEMLWLQLGLGGAAMLVLHLTLSRTIPQMLRPFTDALLQTSRALERLAEQQGQLSQQLARLEGKFDFANELTPVQPSPWRGDAAPVQRAPTVRPQSTSTTYNLTAKLRPK